MRLLLSLALVLAGCAHPPPEVALPKVQEAQAKVDWDAAGKEVVDLLAAYLAVDTTNPPGNEALGVDFLGAVLDREGIPWERVVLAPGRDSLIARLEGGDKPALCLLSHIDVVPVEPERWNKPAFSGLVEDGFLYGRGALDMKSLGAMELQTMVLLKRQGVALDRDLVLLAVADEEVDNLGAKQLAGMWEKIGCSHVINEGGIGVRGALLDDQLVFPVSITEKGNLWVKMIASGTPGHGSTPRPDQAPDRLLAAVEKLKARDVDVDIQPAMREMLRRAGQEHGGVVGFVMSHRATVGLLVKPKLLANPITTATITNTINVTGFGGASNMNVVPAEAYAQLDCRMLPGTTTEQMLAYLRELVDDEKVRFEVVGGGDAVVTPWDDPLFDAITRNLVDGRDHVVAAPFISIGSTDSTYLRPLGVHAYGINPLEVSTDDLVGMHGDNERISVVELQEGLRRLYSIVVDFAGQ